MSKLKEKFARRQQQLLQQTGGRGGAASSSASSTLLAPSLKQPDTKSGPEKQPSLAAALQAPESSNHSASPVEAPEAAAAPDGKGIEKETAQKDEEEIRRQRKRPRELQPRPPNLITDQAASASPVEEDRRPVSPISAKGLETPADAVSPLPSPAAVSSETPFPQEPPSSAEEVRAFVVLFLCKAELYTCPLGVSAFLRNLRGIFKDRQKQRKALQVFTPQAVNNALSWAKSAGASSEEKETEKGGAAGSSPSSPAALETQTVGGLTVIKSVDRALLESRVLPLCSSALLKTLPDAGGKRRLSPNDSQASPKSSLAVPLSGEGRAQGNKKGRASPAGVELESERSFGTSTQRPPTGGPGMPLPFRPQGPPNAQMSLQERGAGPSQGGGGGGGAVGSRRRGGDEDLEALLNAPSAREKALKDEGDELSKLLAAPSALQALTAKKFQNQKGSSLKRICANGTKADCFVRHLHQNGVGRICNKIHFRRVILPHTDMSLGDCSYLDTCRNMNTCKFVHYEVDVSSEELIELAAEGRPVGDARFDIGIRSAENLPEWPAQWIKCDIRTFDFTMFGNDVKVVMADPPWDIHMSLPYGTMRDDEMTAMRVDQIHQEGIIFLWVTGRAMELARECMQVWGYRRVEELIWVKTNQLHRMIRTGRTGHWLNHSKEHCLIGIKGPCRWANKNIDCDVIVAEVRETSRKPDEIYRIIERMAPGCLKVELFGRMHNTRKNWITLGNQLKGVRLTDPGLRQKYNAVAPRLNLPLCDNETGETVAPPPSVREKEPTERNFGMGDEAGGQGNGSFQTAPHNGFGAASSPAPPGAVPNGSMHLSEADRLFEMGTGEEFVSAGHDASMHAAVGNGSTFDFRADASASLATQKNDVQMTGP
uniref:Uncharacterized protein n=1 Tax=Chromera velia CCMP2878 TaxID=1169474 RepID=A0A0G4FK01_9ALVE|eukprot:Cvel_3436.t1-p1 / transcript=Cvel_3436.t1 / gene=Cvel_3436 / organism=Chromera_velia_CCMP2878 / gene_product=Probable N6-adenosine-methyltransferase MT-A70-like, putative / transcript_product=Probable N6-adenosine-methyltransferase MT-A70-like, putative / location=Cvel_scaffold138:67217-72675(+) / protein_length=881 / sequence_SO=supercontig / SO=protein_coding / is_pseudo=false